VTDSTLGAFDVVDVHNPAAPVVVSSQVGICGSAWGVALQGHYAFAGCGTDNSVKVFDLSNPLSPLLVDTMPVAAGGTTIALELNGNDLYALSRTSHTMSILDVSNPAAPSLISQTVLPGDPGAFPRDVAFRGNDAYVLTNNGLYVYDVSNPADPTALGHTQGPTPGTSLDQARAIQFVGNYVLLAVNLDQAVATIDISDPDNPVYVGSFQGPDPGQSLKGITDIWVSGDEAYTSDDIADTIGELDITDPTNISWLGEIPRNTDELAGVQQFAGGDDPDYLYYIAEDDSHGTAGVGVLSALPQDAVGVAEPMTIMLFGGGFLLLLKSRARRAVRSHALPT
jgi:hypothetical protein